MSFDYLHLFRPTEHSEDYQFRKPNDENFLFKIEDKKYIHVGVKLLSFETNDEIAKYSSTHGFNDVKFPIAYSEENIYFMLHQKYVPFLEYENSTVKNEYEYLYKKGEEYGNDFSNCQIIHSKQKSISYFISYNWL